MGTNMCESETRIKAFVEQWSSMHGHGDSIQVLNPGSELEVELKASELRLVLQNQHDLREVVTSLLAYIDAIPSETVANFPTMPGVDRDYVEFVLENDEEALEAYRSPTEAAKLAASGMRR
ncbi:hypothetical protein TH5_01770 [Thalassospira xianhensis MCCC 1A02616]|uniref:Uncharacterized protein n=2 Tax=Thalassospira xianhensis TaxID=478503 RepID=A0A367UHL0_9PROT|nr:hypothetical protein TH5_01770 [Thalassospira xianhensis MCCC 1A02616]